MNAGWALLAERCAAVPATLQLLYSEASPGALAAVRFAETADPRLRFVVTGIGASEGPARLLAYLLGEHAGAAARFTPLSALAGARLAEPPPRADADAVLVVFSQGLSPNAQLALLPQVAARFAALIVYTSVSASDAWVAALLRRGAIVAVLPPVGPPGEDRLFLRVLGPAAAQLAAAQLAEAVAVRRGRSERLPLAAALQAAQSGSERAREAIGRLQQKLCASGLVSAAALAEYGLGALWRAQPELRLALCTSGGYDALCLGLRWKFLEGAGLAEPPAWDVLQVAHGPLQQSFERPLFLCTLGRGKDALEQALFARLAAALPPHHLILPLAATLSGPLALLEHDIQCNELLLSILRGRDWDLLDWPGRARDGSLYAIADPAELQAEPEGRDG